VSGFEQQLVHRAIGSKTGRPGTRYVDYFDFDSDGAIERSDWKEAQRRLGKRYSYSSSLPRPGKALPVLRPSIVPL
jgi:hypothetical protein